MDCYHVNGCFFPAETGLVSPPLVVSLHLFWKRTFSDKWFFTCPRPFQLPNLQSKSTEKNQSTDSCHWPGLIHHQTPQGRDIDPSCRLYNGSTHSTIIWNLKIWSKSSATYIFCSTRRRITAEIKWRVEEQDIFWLEISMNQTMLMTD